jgi:23S rRNA (cytidine1920-2'-O)/16S rRNA (cytidine1409-2'-O)-methyltransferase
MTGPRERPRLDAVLVLRGLAPTRSQAQALVLAGRVRSEGRRLDKPGERVRPDLPLEIDPGPRWVGRGGEKLEGAIERLAIDPAGRDVLDVGSSTGGFTQVLLARGAARVAAVDVGRGQLDWSLRNDPRVSVLEGRNARHLSPADLPFVPSLAVIDVSFISLLLVIPAVVRCLAPGGEIVALVKPQFEVGRRLVGRNGVVRDPALHRDVLSRLASRAEADGWGLRAIVPSPIRGAEGNVEFFVLLRPGGPAAERHGTARRIEEAIDEAHGDAR